MNLIQKSRGKYLKTNVKSNQTFLVSLGTAIDYYNFVIYDMLFIYLSRLFFAGDVESLYMFFIGYIVRPIGDIVFGVLGDKFGRKFVFVFTMILIATSTLAISVLPTYSTIGFVGGVLLILLRMIQSLSFSAELPCAITFVHESVLSKNLGLNFGILMTSISIGDVLASFVMFLLTYFLSDNEILDYGWRIPFLFGALLAFMNIFTRNAIKETSDFKEIKIKKSALSLLREVKWRIIMVGVFINLPPAFLVLFNIYSPIYLSKHFGYDSSFTYEFLLYATILSSFLSPLFGGISDNVGAKNVLSAYLVILILCSALVFGFIDNKLCLIYTIFVYQVISYLFYTSSLVILGNLFSSETKNVSISICYNAGYYIASVILFIAIKIVDRFNMLILPCLIVMFLCLITLLCTKNLDRNSFSQQQI